MLEQAWLLPAIPALSFVLILLFGKRFPNKGSEIGILAVGTHVRAVDRRRPSSGSTGSTTPSGHSEGLRALGRGIFIAEGPATAPRPRSRRW